MKTEKNFFLSGFEIASSYVFEPTRRTDTRIWVAPETQSFIQALEEMGVGAEDAEELSMSFDQIDVLTKDQAPTDLYWRFVGRPARQWLTRALQSLFTHPRVFFVTKGADGIVRVVVWKGRDSIILYSSVREAPYLLSEDMIVVPIDDLSWIR